MPTIEAPAFDMSEHIMRSVRGWLHQLYPSLDIHLMRHSSEESAARPAARIEMAVGPGWDELTAGASWVTGTVIVHYAGKVGKDALWDVERFAGKVVSAATRPRGRIPLSLYNFTWPQPPDITVASVSGGTLPGVIDVAVAAVAGDGTSAAPSEPVRLVVPDDATVGVQPRNWPPGRPLAASWEIYAAVHGGQLKLQGETPAGTVFELTALDADGAKPTTNRHLYLGGLRCDSADTATVEAAGQEQTFDTAVTLRLRALVHRVWDAQMASEFESV